MDRTTSSVWARVNCQIAASGNRPHSALVYLGVFSTAIAFYIYYYILEEHGAFEASLVSYLVPIVATLVGVFVLEESINLLTIAGFGLVAVGFTLLKRDAIVDVVGGSFGIARL
jgi:drug/metabolite transporter (DMT)-like permease